MHGSKAHCILLELKKRKSHYHNYDCGMRLLSECQKHSEYGYKDIFCLFCFCFLFLFLFFFYLKKMEAGITKSSTQCLIKINCYLVLRARWNALAKNLACFKVGKRLL